MPDDTLKVAEECRDCKAGATQARGMDLRWRCMTHGVVSLNDYDRAIIARKDAEHAALRAAALLAVDQLSVADEGYARAIGQTLKAALDATPWEPSEDQVERAARVLESAASGGAAWDARGEYDQQRIAALVAALEEERGKFQRETLRTSELTALLLRVEKLHSDRGHEPGAWSRGCPDCALVAEARALIATPINLRALGQSEEATSA